MCVVLLVSSYVVKCKQSGRFRKIMSLSFFIFILTTLTCNQVLAQNEPAFHLSLIHLNDFHARFEETSPESGACRDNNCIGGFSRTYTAINNLLQTRTNTILLNAGDNFQGTLWYNIYKWDVTQNFLNMLPWDVYTLGNHEFDDKIAGVVPFIKALKAPTVAVNIDDSEEPDLQGIYKKSIVLERAGKKIGIIGVLLSTTNELSSTEKLKFLDESETVNREAERLVAEEAVDTIIVLSHCGYDVDQEIASKASPKIGVIVGAHSHTFLYTGDNPPGGLTPAGPYPTIVDHADGRKILIVQASAYTQFLGDIIVRYNNNGDVVSWEGAPIYLDQSIPQDPEINSFIDIWKESIDEFGNRLIGKSLVYLEQSSCRYSECNLGNLIADAMVHSYLETEEEDAWTAASIAVTNPGGIRTSINSGDITFNDLVTAQPFENTFDVGEIEGRYIKEFLEFSATPYNNRRIQADINLLQVSGMRIVFNVTQPVGARVQSVKIRCRKCLVPKYEDLNMDETYKIVVNSFLAGGGDGFVALSNNFKNRQIGVVDLDGLQDFLEVRSPLVQPTEGRIEVVE